MTSSEPGPEPATESAADPATGQPLEHDPYPSLSAEAREVLADERERARVEVHELIDLLEAERARVADLKKKWQLAQSGTWQLRQLRGRALRPLRRLVRGRPSAAS